MDMWEEGDIQRQPVKPAFSRSLAEGLAWWLRGKESTCQYRRHGIDP